MRHKGFLKLWNRSFETQGETRIWTTISIVSWLTSLLPKKTMTKPLKTRWNIFFAGNMQYYFQTFFLFYTLVSFHREAVPTSCSKNRKKPRMRPNIHKWSFEQKSPMHLHLRCKRSATFLCRPYTFFCGGGLGWGRDGWVGMRRIQGNIWVFQLICGFLGFINFFCVWFVGEGRECIVYLCVCMCLCCVWWLKLLRPHPTVVYSWLCFFCVVT